MRTSACITAALILASATVGQDPPAPPRFEVLHNVDLYKQGTPRETLNSILGAIERERYDYILAHLLDPEFVDARLATTQEYFERVASEQIGATVAGQLLKAEDFQKRVREVGTRLNARNLADQMKRKFEDEPDNLKELKRFAREGEFKDAGDTSTVTHKDIKNRALYFKRIGGRWFIENRKEDRPAKE
jgi:hypothetical protein